LPLESVGQLTLQVPHPELTLSPAEGCLLGARGSSLAQRAQRMLPIGFARVNSRLGLCPISR
jgi:hypothetical protein